MTKVVTEAQTMLNDPLHELIRTAVLGAYHHEFNAGKSVDPFLVEAIVHKVTAALENALAAKPSEEPRMLAFEALETERIYQDAGFGNAANTITGHGPGNPMTPGECLLTIDKILREAINTWYKPQSKGNVAHLVRKIGGVAVQFMERYGAPPRAFTEAQRAELAVRSALRDAVDMTKADRGATGVNGPRDWHHLPVADEVNAQSR